MSTSTHTIQVTFTSRNVGTLLFQLHNVVKSRLVTYAIDKKNVINIGYTRWCTTWLVCIWRINLSIIMCIYIRFNHVYPLVIQHHGKSLFLMGTCGCKWTSLKKKTHKKNWLRIGSTVLISIYSVKPHTLINVFISLVTTPPQMDKHMTEPFTMWSLGFSSYELW